MQAWLLVLHLPAMVLWVGSLLVVTLAMAAHSQEAGAEARAALARLATKILQRLAPPGAALSVLTGIALLLTNLTFYGRAGWFHVKMLLVVLLVGLDLRIHFRSKALQAGRIRIERREGMILHSAVALVFLGILILVLVKPI